MRERVVRETERRLAGDVLAEALGGQARRRRAARPAAAVRDRRRGGGARLRRSTTRTRREPALELALADAGVAGAGRDHAAAGGRCCARWSTRRAGDPVEVAGALRVGARRRARARCAPRPAARAPVGSLRRAFHEARCALEATSLADGDAPEVASIADLGAFTLLLSLQDDEALRLYCDSVLGPIERTEGEYGGELLRSLEAFIEHNGQWERAARELYCHRHTLRYRIRQDRGADRPRPLAAPRDRIEFWLALRARELVDEHRGAARRVLGAGGTIAPAIVRDLAESEEVERLLLLDLDGERAEAVARRARRRQGARARARVDARERPRWRRARGLRRARQLGQLPGQPRRDARLPRGGCHYLDLGGLYWMTGRQLELGRRVRARGPAGAARHRLGPGQDERDGARGAARELGDAVERDRRARPPAATSTRPPGFSVPYALQTLVDELTMAPVVLRDGEPVEIEPLAAGGEVDFGEPIGAAETIHTLHSELRTFGEASAAARRASGSRCRPALLERAARADRTRPRRRSRAAAGEAAAALGAARSPCTWSRRPAADASVRVRAVTEPHGALGPRRRRRLDGAPAAAAVRLLARGRDRGARRAAARALRRPGGPVRRARARAAAGSRSTTGEEVRGMKVGVPTEIKADEYRVALTPAGVRELAEHGHEVLIQAGAGEGSAISDADYEAQGARIVPDAEAVFGEAELVLKVKEPQPEEVELLRPGHDPVHLPAPGAGARADPRPVRVGRHLRRLRDRRGRARAAAAAGADERDRRQDRHPGRRLHAREAARRPRHPARRRARAWRRRT